MTPENKSENSNLTYAWYVAIVLMLCNTLSFIDRQILSLLVKPIKEELLLSDTDIGWLQGAAFAIFYTLLGLPMGRFADRGSRRTLISVGIFFWSLMTATCTIARSFWSLFFARMGVGVGEATLSPSAFSLIADYFPAKKLGTALSIFSMGIFFGSGLGLILSGLVIGKVSQLPPFDFPLIGTISPWRMTFLIAGLPGLLMAFLVYTIKEPVRKNLLRTSEGEASKLSLSEVVAQLSMRWQSVLGVCLGFAFQAMCNYAQQAWLATFFQRVHGWSPKQAGVTLGILSLATGLAGNYLGGVLCDYWQRKKVIEAPLKVGVLATVCAGFFFCLVMFMPNENLQIMMLIPSFFFLAMPIGSTYASLQLIFPNQVRAQVGAVQILSLNLIGLVLGPLVTGVLTDRLFKNPNMVGFSIAVTVGVASLISATLFRLTFKSYRKHYAMMQEAVSS
jgi:MFS family permease